eukprot:26288-Amphidinium_carterae.2
MNLERAVKQQSLSSPIFCEMTWVPGLASNGTQHQHEVWKLACRGQDKKWLNRAQTCAVTFAMGVRPIFPNVHNP